MRRRYLLVFLLLILPVAVLCACRSGNEQKQNASNPESTDTPNKAEQLNLYFTQNEVTASGKNGISEGSDASYQRWYGTDYIDVKGMYAISYELAAHSYIRSVAFFDASKTYISGIGTVSTSDYTVIDGHVRVPDNAAFVKFCTFTGAAGIDAFDNAHVYIYRSSSEYEEYVGTRKHDGSVIACFGDSLTEGDYGTYVTGVPNKHFRNYPYFLAKELGCTTVNFGKCGITTEGYLSFLKSGAIDVSEADIVLIMLGTNAGLQSDAQVNSYYGILDELKERLRQDAKVVLLTPPHSTSIKGKVNYGNARVAKVAAERVRAIGQERGLTVIDVFEESPINEENEAMYQPYDGLHMAEAGYRALAQFISQELERKGIL